MERIVELGCVLVPEGRQLFSPLTVRENLLLGAYLPPARRPERVRESLEEVFSPVPAPRRAAGPAGRHALRRASSRCWPSGGP